MEHINHIEEVKKVLMKNTIQ